MKKSLTILLSLVLLISLLCGCGNELTAPTNIVLADRTISWDKVGGASSYIIDINGKEFTSVENSLVLDDAYFGQITIKVKAVKDDKASGFSEPKSLACVLKLKTPTNVRQEGNMLIWDAVANAVGYIVKINGAEFLAETNEYVLNISSPVSAQVLAAGRSDKVIVSSDYSEAISVRAGLKAPSNLRVSNNIASWDKVDGMTSYKLMINEEIVVRDSESYSLDKYVGELVLKVMAVGNGTDYIDSAYCKPISYAIPRATLDTPTNLVNSDGSLSWDNVGKANGYKIFINGKFLKDTTTNSTTLTAEQQRQTVCVVQVQAVSSYHLQSALSEKLYAGTSSPTTPTIITLENQLRELNSYGCYKLGADIVLTAKWSPIDFFGIFDGGNKKISGLNITDDDSCIGFFKNASGAKIANLTLDGAVNLTLAKASSSKVGGLAGYVVNSVLENVSVNVNIDIVCNNGLAYVGGIAGISEYSNYTSVHFNGAINASNSVVGGFVGKTQNPQKSSVISNSSATATVTVSGGESCKVGGFVGMMTDNSLTIKGSKANATIVAPVYVGGFVGYFGSGNVEDCYATGSVKATNMTLNHIGGFIGRLEGYNSKVSRCISLCSVETLSIGENIKKGGFVGYTVSGNFASIYEDCFYDGVVANMDRIGAGKGDGIIKKSTSELQSANALANFSTTVWDFSAGKYPKLIWKK